MERKTIYQRLENLFGPEKNKISKSKYSLDDRQLLKTQSKEEYEVAKLQAQQNKYLANQWQKVDGELFQQSVYYETTRIASYSDFEGMEFYPEIAAALDIFMEEATVQNKEGRILNIFSESKRVKRILQDLFFNRLDIHTSLPMWTRNTCKYGDNFLFLKIDDENGIVGVKQLPNIEIERKEADNYKVYNANDPITKDGKKDSVTFFWKNKDITFNSWQIAHFRLLGDDRRLPYGTSILEKARRIWKQLLLSEDAMLIYRVTRAPERRIFKIFVGNIDEQDVPSYVQKIANNFKKTPIIDQRTGQIDTRYNQMAQDQDYFIPVRDPSAPSPIETLAGAQNLSEIADIEYLQKKLFTALRVPKPFLGFEETNGDGKNLALQDIRFTRTINRIQQSMIQELNKIAIIHLYLLGLEDELENFTLSLNNPSTQADMLRTEQLQQKIQLYKDSVVDSGNGFGAMSMTRAKKEILGMSEEEIRLDIEQQRLEKAAAAELANTANIIKKTGVFDKVDRMYGEFGVSPDEAAKSAPAAEGEEGMGGMEPSFGGGGSSFSAPEPTEPTEPAAETESPEPTAEGFNRSSNNLLTEEVNKRKFEEKMKKYKNIYTNRLLESLDRDVEKISNHTNIDKNKDFLNDEINKISKIIDDVIKD